jgi:PAS domain S-box-containing protein
MGASVQRTFNSLKCKLLFIIYVRNHFTRRYTTDGHILTPLGSARNEAALDKKPYKRPRITPFSPGQVPEWIAESFQNQLDVTDSSRPHVAPIYTTLVDNDRKYVWVSDSFCELLGYRSEELIGKRYDEITAPNTTNIPTTYNLFSRLGYMHRLWMLVHRTGYRILIRYEAWLRPDRNIQSNIELCRPSRRCVRIATKGSDFFRLDSIGEDKNISPL